uniref:Glyco_hydro_35 domain-containing protein n=1 Tax=Strongyloides venezuelensis TaxID=75913 RepID=A0A0K0F8Z6_STRVS
MKIYIFFLFKLVCELVSNERKFSIDYTRHEFMLDNKPFRYISGEIHYFRVPLNYWRDRLRKIRSCGLNAIQVYIPWNYHETKKWQYNFTEKYDVVRFLKIAQEEGLFVLLRPGPYICAEWENGGLPWWLTKNISINLRSSDKSYLNEVEKWWNILMNKIKPQLYKNGGNILMIQIENEYGSYEACDKKYLEFLRDETWKILGNDVVLYTTDGASDNMLKCGSIDGVFPTVDFGVVSNESKVMYYFDLQKKYSKGGPLVNSEFYSGWFTGWGQRKWNFPDTKSIIDTMTWMWNFNASFSIYMMAGGTSFEYWNGKVNDGTLVTTSYDYNSPIHEDGDIGNTYKSIQNWILQLDNWKWKPRFEIKNTTRKSYGKIIVDPIKYSVNLMAENCVPRWAPLTFEEFNSPYGFLIYRVNTDSKYLTNISIPGIKDAGYIIINNDYVGKINSTSSTLKVNYTGDFTIQIVAENMGRQNYETIHDIKGIINNRAYFDNKTSNHWQSCYMTTDIIDNHFFRKGKVRFIKNNKVTGPTILLGTLDISDVHDTYIFLPGFTKGVVVINGYNIGRYWNVMGPQQSLYVPASFLKKGSNRIIVFELEGNVLCNSSNGCFVHFIKDSIWNWEKEKI